MDTLPFWKKIYQTVTGYSNNITNDIVEEILKQSKKDLLDGISVYKPYKEDSFTEWSKKNTKVDADVQGFVRRLSRDLNLDSSYAWLVLCNYFMYEYYGKIKDIKFIARYESNTLILTRNIWLFYSAERMFVIRTLRYVFEHASDQDHPFYAEYDAFIKSVNMNELKNNLVRQFEKLVKEITPETASNSGYVQPWVSRNNKEQIEILMLITIVTKHCEFNVNDFTALFKAFMEHNFTRHPLYFESTEIVPPSEFFNVKCAEIGCFITLLNNFKHSNNLKQFLLKKIEDDIIDIQVQGNQTVVLFMWIILKAKVMSDEDNEDELKKCIRLTMVLFNRGAFESLHEVISNLIFQKNRAGDIVFESVYDIVTELFQWFPFHKEIYKSRGAISVTTEVFKNNHLLRNRLSGDDSFMTIIKIAYNAFPYDFLSFTKISSVMLQSGIYSERALQILNGMSTYLSNLTATAPDGEYYELNEEYHPFDRIPGLSFPPGTRVQSYEIFGKKLARFIGKYSYFTLIQQMFFNMINQCKRSRCLDPELVLKVVEGYRLVIQIVKHPNASDQQINKIHDCIKALELVCPTFIEGELRCFDLIQILFEMQISLIMHRKQVLRRDFVNIFLPSLSRPKSNINDLLFKEIYEKCITLACLQEEERMKTHSFLLQYIDLIQYAIKDNIYHQEIQLPGITYLLNHVFPHYENWGYNNDREKTVIAKKCLLIFHKVLYENHSSNETRTRIKDFVTHSLLNNRVAVQAFFNLLAKGNMEIQNAIVKQTFSRKNSDAEIFKNVRLQLSIMLYLMKSDDAMHRESLFYEKLKSYVKPLTSFIGNAFNSKVAQFSCRIIELMSRDSNIPMLALLEMDYHQVQSFFLEKLRDPMEDEELKLVIIDLVETSIRNQHGMTAAFFNIPARKQWDSNEEREKMGDSMTDFMLDYLQNIRTNPMSLENPLQLGILKILLNLWTNRKNNLIEDVISLKQFWPLLANPLYCSFIQDPEIYAIVFSILSLQMCNTFANIDVNLKQSVEKFFKDRKQMGAWMEFMDSAFQYIPESSTDEKAEKTFYLLKSWVELIVVAKKYIPEAFDEEVKNILIEHCLDGALYHLSVPSIMKVPIAWMELYLMLITEWKVSFNREKNLVEKLTNILHQFNNSLNVMSSKTRKTYLSVIYKTVVGLKSFFENNSRALEQFLMPVGKMLNYEYDELYYLLWNSSDESKLQFKIINWVLVVCIANGIMDLDTIKDHCVWFRLNNYIEKITGCFRPLFYNRQTTTVVKFMLESLIRYANTPMVFDFLNNDFIKITENMRTPDNFCLWKKSSDGNIPVYLREWCVSYMLLIKLFRTLVQKLGHKMVYNSCMFLMLHDKIINEILMLSEHSADKTALILTRELLDFINTLLDWKYTWYCYFKDSFLSIITGIKKCLNACISALLRPKNLLCYKAVQGGRLEVTDEIPQTHLIPLANIFIEISCLASQCLLKANRTLLEYFDVYKSFDPIFEIIENDFRAPRFEVPVTPNVTFGRMLCLVHFLCTTLNQMESRTPSVKVPRKADEPVQSLLSFSKKVQHNNLPDLLNAYNIESEDLIVFVQYEESSNIAAGQKLSSFFRYSMYEYTGLSAPWVTELDKSKVEKTLEVLMCLLASQIFLYTRTMDQHHLPQYKRELCAELLFITEFVKKRSSGQQLVSARKDERISNVNFLDVILHWFVNICQLYKDSYYNY